MATVFEIFRELVTYMDTFDDKLKILGNARFEALILLGADIFLFFNNIGENARKIKWLKIIKLFPTRVDKLDLYALNTPNESSDF